MEFETKDSGERVDFPSGMRRDTDKGKPRYDLIPLMPLRRLAELYQRGAEKYGDSNWQLANSPEELQRFKASTWRHFIQFMNGETDEDHGIAAVWGIFATLTLEEKLNGKEIATEPSTLRGTEPGDDLERRWEEFKKNHKKTCKFHCC